jgi:PKD repeat protein
MKALIAVAMVGLTAVAVATTPAAGSDVQWTCNLIARPIGFGGHPLDTGCYFGVMPGATDDYDEGVDNKKPPPPFGDYIYAFFQRPAWQAGAIMNDWRAPLPEGTTKEWGADPLNPAFPAVDCWLVTTTMSAGDSGCPDPCGQGETYPVAISISITWEFGVSIYPPPLLPPEDYTFTVKYAGGIRPKPEGCAEPGVTVPPIGTCWDMKATPEIVVPVWPTDFHPFTADCSDQAPSDSARFIFIVTNPDAGPVCQLVMTPDQPLASPAEYQFSAIPSGHAPFGIAWDFGDGGSAAGSPVTHTDLNDGDYPVTCTVVDVTGAVNTCAAVAQVTGAANRPPACCFAYSPSRPDTTMVIRFADCSTDPDPGHAIAAWAWDFGDGGQSSEQNPLHQFAAGDYDVCLTVTDSANAPLSATCCQTISVAEAPRRCAAGIIHTVAGGGTPTDGWGDGGPAVAASLHWPLGVTRDANGDLYIADTFHQVVRKVDPAGVITTIAGTGTGYYSGDGGPATEAELYRPSDVAVASDGSVYISDPWTYRVRRVAPDGIITTVAGRGPGGWPGWGDSGPGTEATLAGPRGLAFGPDGCLYIADASDYGYDRYAGRVWRLDANGIITVVAGGRYSRADGIPATESGLAEPMDVAVGPDGTIYIADRYDRRVRKVDAAGIISTVAGRDLATGGTIGVPLRSPYGVALGSDGSLYISDQGPDLVYRLGPDGAATLVAGGGDPPDGVGDGLPASEAALDGACRLAVTDDDTVYVADAGHSRIRSIGPWGPCYTLSHDPPSPTTGQVVAFSADAADPHGRAFTCAWDFGDGSGAAGSNVAHVYAAPGVYHTCLTVTNELGNRGISCTEVLVTCSGEADAEVVAVLAPTILRISRQSSVIVLLRNRGPTSCAARLELCDAGTGKVLGARTITLPASNGGRISVQVVPIRWHRADAGRCRLEARVSPLAVCDPQPGNNAAAAPVRVMR